MYRGASLTLPETTVTLIYHGLCIGLRKGPFYCRVTFKLIMIKKKNEGTMKARLTNLVMHVIKIHAQKKVTSSWQGTLNNELEGILNIKDSKTDYTQQIEDVYERALGKASGEVFNGVEIEALEQMIDKRMVIQHCKTLVHLGSDTRGWTED